MIACRSCGAQLDAASSGPPAASIAGEICGDEYIESYYFCPACSMYTLEVYIDVFLGEGSSSLSGPISREQGEERIRLIRMCPDPSDKKCRCDAHRRYFDGLSS